MFKFRIASSKRNERTTSNFQRYTHNMQVMFNFNICLSIYLVIEYNNIFCVNRQSSLPSAGSELSLPEGSLDWPDTIDIDGEQVELRKKNKDMSITSSYDSMEGK